MSSVAFYIFLHTNHHSIKNYIHYCAIQFMICSLYKNFQFIFEFKVNCFLFHSKSDSYYDTDMTFFSLHCHEMVLKSSETVDLSIILSNFRTFWNSFCSKVRRGV